MVRVPLRDRLSSLQRAEPPGARNRQGGDRGPILAKDPFCILPGATKPACDSLELSPRFRAGKFHSWIFSFFPFDFSFPPNLPILATSIF